MRKSRIEAAALGAASATLLFLTAGTAMAADDEIMVTDGDLAGVGKPELEVHNNFSWGTDQSPGEGVFAPNHVLRITPEISTGLSTHWDVGLYLPMSWVSGYGLYYDGTKVRAKYIDTHALTDTAHVYYGLQLELAYLNSRVSPDPTSVEVKAIIGTEFGDWKAALNVVEQRDIPDHDLYQPAYAINAKLVRELRNDVAVGFEQYVSWSSTSLEEPVREIDKLSFLTVEWKVRKWNMHLGVGHGWSGSPDYTIVKFVVGVPLD